MKNTWTVTVYTHCPRVRGKLFDDFHSRERRGKEHVFTDEATAKRFAQQAVETGGAWMTKVERSN